MPFSPACSTTASKVGYALAICCYDCRILRRSRKGIKLLSDLSKIVMSWNHPCTAKGARSTERVPVRPARIPRAIRWKKLQGFPLKSCKPCPRRSFSRALLLRIIFWHTLKQTTPLLILMKFYPQGTNISPSKVAGKMIFAGGYLLLCLSEWLENTCCHSPEIGGTSWDLLVNMYPRFSSKKTRIYFRFRSGTVANFGNPKKIFGQSIAFHEARFPSNFPGILNFPCSGVFGHVGSRHTFDQIKYGTCPSKSKPLSAPWFVISKTGLQ